MDLGLRGRTALVAGSTSGLGLAIARALGRRRAVQALGGGREGAGGRAAVGDRCRARPGPTGHRRGRVGADAAARRGLDPAAVRSRSEGLIPVGRYGTPEEFADVAAFLCSARAGYLTGEQVRVDGGLVPGF
jgi:NAD(P)-dependent dehydrogenase (short-subunit alcohol dehydrogenase family)